MIEVESPTHRAIFQEETNRVAIYRKQSNRIEQWVGTGLWIGSKVVAYSSMKLDLEGRDLEILEGLLRPKIPPEKS